MPKKAKQPTNLNAILTVVIISLFVLAIVAYLLIVTINRPAQCPTDAKVCPGGTTVGRSGPKCEFAPCPNNKSIPNTTSLTGTYTCLEPNEISSTNTRGCAFGVTTDANERYLLDTSALDPDVISALKGGDMIKVDGLIIPIEAVSTDRWQNYDLKGIVSVSNITKL